MCYEIYFWKKIYISEELNGVDMIYEWVQLALHMWEKYM
jgi:hypothetical protein